MQFGSNCISKVNYSTGKVSPSASANLHDNLSHIITVSVATAFELKSLELAPNKYGDLLCFYKLTHTVHCTCPA